ncbi:SFRP2 protein, partial [Anseranas semipalmata]|nr:SFRP2 protein [Anseranas semipalmata]
RSSCKAVPGGLLLCQGVGYSRMRLPNLLGHESVKEALQQASPWVPLLAKRCHRDTKKFLCSLFAPVCLSELEEPVSPCRALCEGVRDGCAPVMAAFGFPWPEMFNCSRFPQGAELCVPPAGPEEPPPPPKDDAVCAACLDLGQPDRDFLEHFCSQDFDGDLKVVAELKGRTLYRQRGWSEDELRQPALWLPDGESCACAELPGPGAAVLAMGHRVGGRLVLSWLRRWQRGERELRKLGRAARKLRC